MGVTRRQLLIFGASLTFNTPATALKRECSEDKPQNWLGPTPFVDSRHPSIKTQAALLTNGLSDQSQKAMAIFRFVRDDIKFGFSSDFWHNKASEVLYKGVGYCNTKSTLFVALLRASDIPARQVFVDIKADVLHGIIDPGTPYVDHSYVELFLNDKWIMTDAYIVDEQLFHPAQKILNEQERLLGFGVHQTGSCDFDGRNPSFSQFNVLDPRPISSKKWGVFEDVGDFYSQTPDAWNRLNSMLRFGFLFVARSANSRAEQIRKQGQNL